MKFALFASGKPWLAAVFALGGLGLGPPAADPVGGVGVSDANPGPGVGHADANPGARRLYERALIVREKSLGPEHPRTLDSLMNVGRALRQRGDFAGAQALFAEAGIETKEGKGLL